MKTHDEHGGWDGAASRPGNGASCDHVVQFYHNADHLLNSLERFVCEGLRAGEGVVVIATMSHLFELERRLGDHEFAFHTMQARGQYVRLNAHEALWQFMVDGWPDETLFRAFVDRLQKQAGRDGRRVRAFGEMVAVLWSQGKTEATIELERMWHRLSQERKLLLYCAYPKEEFGVEQRAGMDQICAAHSRVLVA